MSNFRKIEVADFSDYEDELHNNGGKYVYYTTYLLDDDHHNWQVYYSSSSEFAMCPCCGKFLGESEECSCDGPAFVNELELQEIIKKCEDDPNLQITFFE